MEESNLLADGHNPAPKYYLEDGKIVDDTGQTYKSKINILNRVGYLLISQQKVGDWVNLRPDDEIAARLAKAADAFI